MKKRIFPALAVTVLLFLFILPLTAQADTVSEIESASQVSDSSVAAQGGIITATEGETVNVDERADKEDGINLTAATAGIVSVSAVLFVTIVCFTVVLAKRNGKEKD